MIPPDTKSWTWVLERPCPECGFDASVCAASSVSGLLRDNARSWIWLMEGGKIHAGRPTPTTWSSLEYACHVRDVCRIFDARIALMLMRDTPKFANWDQDETAVKDNYEGQDPVVVVGDLVAAAGDLANRLDLVTGGDWLRPGLRGDGASFTVDSIARYMIHDPIHHLWDVTTALR
jgi:hypothetical protein